MKAMGMGKGIVIVGAYGLLLAGAASRPLDVANPSFEADRYGNPPGSASGYGRVITGWTYQGNAGLNPVWQDTDKPAGPQRPFADNGVTPHGRQVALLQNECSLSQTVAGFRAGTRYRVTYYENARVYRRAEAWPHLEVSLGGECIVSNHEVTPVEPAEHHTLPYAFVESALFSPPRDGAFDLVFTATTGGGVTLLLDHVTIREAE